MTEQDDARSPLAEEAVRLIGAVQDWARQNFPASRTSPEGHGGPECQWCPLCQFMSVLRGERPEVSERVAEAGTAIASAFRALVDAAASPATAPPTPAEPPAPRVQRIDLGDGAP